MAVVSSGFFGSLSGSVFANIVSTGSITIPAMKRLGYPPHYAAAIEACASAGGMLMPPVMGTVAFVMCAFLNIPYATVVTAAFIPSILYYIGLLMQVDGYAAKVGLSAMPAEEIPSLRKTLKDGWPFIFVFFFLLWGLIYMRWEALTPFYASGLLVLLSFARKETILTPRRIIKVLVIVGNMISMAMAIILPIGFIICGLLITGVSVALTSGIIFLGKGNLLFILLLGVLACYLMGMAGMISPAYIFLAISLAPAAIKAGGLNELAVHLFIAYYAMLAVLTPPVAAGAFLAATLAGSSPMRTAVLSMRLGFVKYVIPFFFLFQPALILQGSLLEALYYFVPCLLGVLLIAAGLEGYLVLVGTIGWVARSFFVITGILIAFPEWKTTIIGAALGFFGVAGMRIAKSMAVRD